MRGRRGLELLRPLLVTTVAAELARRLLTPRGPVRRPLPVDLGDHFSAAEIDRGRAYARPQRRLALASSAIQGAGLVALVARPPATLAARRKSSRSEVALLAAALTVGLEIPGLPLRALARRRAVAAGLDTQSWRGWASDLTKASAIEAGLGAGLCAGIVPLSRRYGAGWWAPAGAAITTIAGCAGALAPVLLDPIFNAFEPLPDGETRRDVLALADAAGVRVGDVYAVDASRRTTAANAYVTGLGPTKRVVLYDTMLDRYGRDEIRLVVAHELGHLRHRDVPRNLAYLGLIASPLCWGAQRLGAALAGADPAAPVSAATLPGLLLAAGLVSAPIGPIVAGLSRAMERRADQFSLELAGAPEAFVSFERRASLQNLSDLEPGRLSRLTASHPPAGERIGAALAHAETTNQAPAVPAETT